MYQASHPKIISGLENFNKIAHQRLVSEINFGFTEEGVHKENSPAYHRGMLQNIFKAKEILHTLPFTHDSASELFIDELLNKALYFLACIAHPDGMVPIIGDSVAIPITRSMPHLENLQNYQYHEYVANLGKKGKRIQAFNDFSKSGYVTLRTPTTENPGNPTHDFHLIFKCGLLSTYHRQDDDLNILLYAYGEQWFCLLYTSPSPRDQRGSRMPSSA